jgi:hypothetical protein
MGFLVLPTNLKLMLKWMKGTNALAYYTLVPDATVIYKFDMKRCFFQLFSFIDKLEGFFQAGFFTRV